MLNKKVGVQGLRFAFRGLAELTGKENNQIKPNSGRLQFGPGLEPKGALKDTGELNEVAKGTWTLLNAKGKCTPSDFTYSAGEEHGKSIKGRQGKFRWILDWKESSSDTSNKIVLTRVLDRYSI